MEDKKSDDRINNLLSKGFLKTSLGERVLSSENKAVLNRQGNMLFNQEKYNQATKIFLTTGYSDGLSRIGDLYYENSDRVNALKFYILAKRKDLYQPLLDDAVAVINDFLLEDIRNS